LGYSAGREGDPFKPSLGLSGDRKIESIGIPDRMGDATVKNKFVIPTEGRRSDRNGGTCGFPAQRKPWLS
jgi:hypothetical protein